MVCGRLFVLFARQLRPNLQHGKDAKTEHQNPHDQHGNRDLRFFENRRFFAHGKTPRSDSGKQHAHGQKNGNHGLFKSDAPRHEFALHARSAAMGQGFGRRRRKVERVIVFDNISHSFGLGLHCGFMRGGLFCRGELGGLFNGGFEDFFNWWRGRFDWRRRSNGGGRRRGLPRLGRQASRHSLAGHARTNF